MWDLLSVLAISHVLAFYTAYLRDRETEAESSLVTCSLLAPLCLAYSQSVGLSFTWKHVFFSSVLRTNRRNVQGHWRQGSNQPLQILSYKEESQSFCFYFLVSKQAPGSPLSTFRL